MVRDISCLFGIVIISKATWTYIGVGRVGKSFVENRGVVFHSFQDIGNRREDFIIHIDQSRCLFCDFIGNRSYSGHCMTFI